MSNVRPMGIAYPPRPLAEPRSGRYAGCKSAAGEVFGCIPHGRGACRESDSFAMWAVRHGVIVSMTTVSISSDPFIPVYFSASNARNFVKNLDNDDWSRCIPSSSTMSGSDYRRIWTILSGDNTREA